MSQKKKTNQQTDKIRNRVATRARLIEAVGKLLAEQGFRAIGVNAIAREAGVDKVLIYRYFGGLPGLIKSFSHEGDFWPTMDEVVGGDFEKFQALSRDEKITHMVINYLNAIRNRPLTQEILAWEMVEQNELTKELEHVREHRTMQIIEKLFQPGEFNQDVEAVFALVGAAINYLVIRSRRATIFSGIDLQSAEGWEKLENTIISVMKNALL